MRNLLHPDAEIISPHLEVEKAGLDRTDPADQRPGGRQPFVPPRCAVRSGEVLAEEPGCVGTDS